MSAEATVRIVFFFGILLIVAACESYFPRRKLDFERGVRWFGNLGIVVLYTAVVRLVFPVIPVGLAVMASESGWGLLNNVSIPFWLAVAMGVIALDFVIYVQHVLFHSVPVLWSFHMMHHADMDFDLTTGVRFHPVEIILSTFIKLGAVAALGPPAAAVVMFEVLLNGTAMFNHGNLNLPLGADRVLRLLVVTPDMHRVHHSVIIRETNSNFGFNLPWWDRLFGTYRDQPAMGHEGMTIGLSHVRDQRYLGLWGMLAMPFTEPPGEYPLSGKGKEPESIRKGEDR